jgi:hypothetical protein
MTSASQGSNKNFILDFAENYLETNGSIKALTQLFWALFSPYSFRNFHLFLSHSFNDFHSQNG